MDEVVSRSKRARGIRIVCGVALSAACVVVFAPAALSYFFVFDDYKLFGQGMGLSIVELLSQPHFLYYRPTVHLYEALETALFGWSYPAAYAGISVVLHAANSVLLLTLMKRLNVPRPAPDIASALFFIAPWSLEAVFWASCRFDLFGALFALIVAHGLVTEGEGRVQERPQWRLFALAMLAFGSKETVLALALACAAFVRLSRPRITVPDAARGMRMVLAAGAVYLLCRWASMSLFSVPDPLFGHRGNLLGLWLSGGAWNHGLSHLGGFWWPPTADGLEGLRALHATGLTIALGVSVVAAPRLSLAAIGAVIVTLLPALWLERDLGSTAGGRLLYMPTLFFAPLIAWGLTQLLNGVRWRPAIGAVLTCSILTTSLSSGYYQSTLWQETYQVARRSMERFHAMDVRNERVHIVNMPTMLREGPCILKDYAFEWYGRDSATGLVSATPVVYEIRNGEAVQVRGWERSEPAVPEGARGIEL